jgi:hypothetical protein
MNNTSVTHALGTVVFVASRLSENNKFLIALGHFSRMRRNGHDQMPQIQSNIRDRRLERYFLRKYQ